MSSSTYNTKISSIDTSISSLNSNKVSSSTYNTKISSIDSSISSLNNAISASRIHSYKTQVTTSEYGTAKFKLANTKYTLINVWAGYQYGIWIQGVSNGEYGIRVYTAVSDDTKVVINTTITLYCHVYG